MRELVKSGDKAFIRRKNTEYNSLTALERIKRFYDEFDELNLLLSSSFGAHSIVLLHMVSRINSSQKITFIDTGNHFQETLDYRRELSDLLNLKIQSITSCQEIHDYIKLKETYKSHPKICCYLKKIRPLDRLKYSSDIWISGLMEWQSDHRSTLDVFEWRKGILKFYPLLDLTEKDCIEYITTHDLPSHPLVNEGYSSIGCTHCTKPGTLREGRWQGNEKTECGLHV